MLRFRGPRVVRPGVTTRGVLGSLLWSALHSKPRRGYSFDEVEQAEEVAPPPRRARAPVVVGEVPLCIVYDANVLAENLPTGACTIDYQPVTSMGPALIIDGGGMHIVAKKRNEEHTFHLSEVDMLLLWAAMRDVYEVHLTLREDNTLGWSVG